MVNLPWPLALRSTQISHYPPVFYPGTFWEGEAESPPREAPKESKIPLEFKIMFMK